MAYGMDVWTDSMHFTTELTCKGFASSTPQISFVYLDHLRGKVLQNSLLNTIENAEVLHDLQILRLAQEQLVGVLARLHRVHHSGGVSHAHLLGHLVGSYVI